jgi:hypothetical protein
MNLRLPACRYLVPAALAFGTVLAADPAKSEENLPPPEATEYWEPVPPVVAAPAGGIPSDAIVLFNGQGLGAWESVKGGAAPWTAEGDAVVVKPKSGNIRTKQGFGDVQLHVEFRTPAVVEGKSQGRGNSGIFLMGLYEVQVLDSYNNATYVNGQAGSIYKQHPPLVNASRGPGEWQAYDIVFVAPRFAADGKLLSPARATVFHNGVLVQHDVIIRGPTVYRGQPAYAPHAAKLPIELQDHNNVTAFRNIWVREITLPASS